MQSSRKDPLRQITNCFRDVRERRGIGASGPPEQPNHWESPRRKPTLMFAKRRIVSPSMTAFNSGRSRKRIRPETLTKSASYDGVRLSFSVNIPPSGDQNIRGGFASQRSRCRGRKSVAEAVAPQSCASRPLVRASLCCWVRRFLRW